MKLALLPKKNRGETVRFSLRLRFGDLASLAGTEPYGSLTAAMLSSGTQKRDRQAFNDEIDRLRAKLAFGGGDASVSASGETVRANLEPLLRLAAEALRTPAFPAAEFDKMIREQIGGDRRGAASTRRRWPSAPPSATRTAYPKGDIRHVGSFDDELAELRGARLDAVRAFHARFYGAEHAELAVVGDFDPDAVVRLATELFGDWKSGAAYARVPYPYQPTVPGTEVIATPEKANASLIGNLALPVRDSSPDFPALAVVDKLLGGGPESRLGRPHPRARRPFVHRRHVAVAGQPRRQLALDDLRDVRAGEPRQGARGGGRRAGAGGEGWLHPRRGRDRQARAAGAAAQRTGAGRRAGARADVAGVSRPDLGLRRRDRPRARSADGRPGQRRAAQVPEARRLLDAEAGDFAKVRK